MKYLEEQGRGFDVGATRVPIVAGAVIFDLWVGDAGSRPDAAMGYEAASQASEGPVALGSIGAGIGATVGKWSGREGAMKGGVGLWTLSRSDGLAVGALVVVNAYGSVLERPGGAVLAGARDPATDTLLDPSEWGRRFGRPPGFAVENTTLAVVMTNARLSKEQVCRVCLEAHDGMALVLRPSHTLYDGDVVFGAALGQVEAPGEVVGQLAAEAVWQAIVIAVKRAEGRGGVPGCGAVK